MSKINSSALKQCLLDSTLKEIAEIEAMDYSFIHASEEFKKRLENERLKRTRYLPKRIALVLVAAILICFSITLTVSAQIRSAVADFFVQIYETFASFFIQETDADAYPMTIEVEYVPSYFGENGYEQIDRIKTDFSVLTICSKNDFNINFSQHIISSNDIKLDAEGASYTMTLIEEQEVYYMVKNSTYIVIWLSNGYSFSLSCEENLGFSEIAKIILSLKPVNE